MVHNPRVNESQGSGTVALPGWLGKKRSERKPSSTGSSAQERKGYGAGP